MIKFERTIPIQLVIALAIQCGVVVWWAASVESKLATISQRVAKLEANDDNRSADLRQVAERLARIEQTVSLQLELLRQMKTDNHK